MLYEVITVQDQGPPYAHRQRAVRMAEKDQVESAPLADLLLEFVEGMGHEDLTPGDLRHVGSLMETVPRNNFV